MPIRFVSLLNGKMFRISYFNYFPDGRIIEISVWVLDLRIIPSFYVILTNVISSGLDAWNYLCYFILLPLIYDPTFFIFISG